jgi:hypothetical protein
MRDMTDQGKQADDDHDYECQYLQRDRRVLRHGNFHRASFDRVCRLVQGSTATLTNHATIASPSAGGGEAVYFLNAGILTNLSAGYIHGQSGGVNAVRFHNNAGTIVNYGKIVAAVAANSAAIALQAGGVVTNKSGGLISGQLFSTNLASASVYNSGTIQGASGGGLNYGAILLAGGGTVTNFTGGHINANTTGAYGIKIYGGAGTVTNAAPSAAAVPPRCRSSSRPALWRTRWSSCPRDSSAGTSRGAAPTAALSWGRAAAPARSPTSAARSSTISAMSPSLRARPGR